MDDLISKQAVIDAIEKLDIPEDMCVFEILSHIELEIQTLSPAQWMTCEGCKHKGKWDNEVELGYNCPCMGCKRRVADNYEQ